MKHASILAVVISVALASPAAADLLQSDHVVVSYAGINKAYAQAIARIVTMARATAIEEFGFDMPATINVKIVVNAAGQQGTRLWTNGRDGIFLNIRSQQDLRKPQEGGVYNIYGMCHEVGHIAMYRLTHGPPRWMKPEAAEGWAHYFGSRVVDVVYAQEGAMLWPDPYDYDADGMKRLNAQIAALKRPAADPDAKPSGIERSAAAWKRLVDAIGDKGAAPVFTAWGKMKHDPAGSAASLDRALATIARDRCMTTWWQEARDVLMLDRGNRELPGSESRTKTRR
jgi:hypothetical protein